MAGEGGVATFEGVGLDLEDPAALDRFDPAALQRMLGRWFDARERQWCLGQAALGPAMVVGICCKEAVYKALGGDSF